MQNSRDLLKWLYAASWIAFALVALLYNPVWVGTPNLVKCVIGLLGAVLIVLALFLGHRWLLYAFYAALGLLLATYAIELVLRTSSYMSVDPNFGLAKTVWLKLSTLYLAPMKLASEGSILPAAVELYWTLGMPALQMGLSAALIGAWLRRQRVRA
jgi:hypothetical protein